MSVPTLDPKHITADFGAVLAAEYNAVRSRIDKDIDAINQIEIFSITASGALFYFGSDKPQFYIVSMLMVMVVAVYGYFRYLTYRHTIRIAENYLKLLTPSLASGKLIRDTFYMEYYDAHRSDDLRPLIMDSFKGGQLKKVRNALWALMFLAPSVHSLATKPKCIIISITLACVALFLSYLMFASASNNVGRCESK